MFNNTSVQSPNTLKKKVVLKYDTVSDALADASIGVGYVVKCRRYSSGGGLIGAVYDAVPPATGTADGFEYLDDTVSGSLFQLQLRIPDVVSVQLAGVYGDSVPQADVDDETDFTTELKNIVAKCGGKSIVFDKDKYYQCRDELVLLPGTTIGLGGGYLRFNVNGQKRNLVTDDNCAVYNGTVQCVTKDATVYGAEYQQPICIGKSNEIVGVDNVKVKRVTLTSTSPEGNALFVFGESNNITCEDIIIPDSAYIGEAIGAHWGVESGGDETQGTGHPNNVTFKNVTIGSMSYSGAAACYFSAPGNLTLENIKIKDYQNGKSIYLFAGDHGYAYATDPLLQTFGPRIKLKNIYGKALSGLFVDMRDTLESGDVWPSNIIVENVNLISRSQTSSSSRGLELGGVDGFSIRNSKLYDFYNSLFINSSVTNLSVEHNVFKNAFKNAVDADNSAGCENLIFKHNQFINSNDSGSGTQYDMVFGSYIDGIVLHGNTFNSPDVTNNVNCLSSAPPRNVVVTDNKVKASGGTCFVFGSSTSAGICKKFEGNTVADSVNQNLRGGQALIPHAVTHYLSSKFPISSYVGPGTPSYGTYHAGDRFSETAPAASGKAETICVEGGTEGSYSEGLTATTDGTATVTLSAASTVLRRGDYVTINSTDVQILSISGTTVTASASIASGSGLSIAYKAGVYKLANSINA